MSYSESFIGIGAEYLSSLGRRNYSPRTVRTYDDILKRFFRYLRAKGVSSVADVDAALIQGFILNMQERKLRQTTMELYTRAVKGLFRYLEAKNMVFVNPAEEMKVARPVRNLMAVPSMEEMADLISAIGVGDMFGIRDRCIVEVSYSCGLRLNELASLDVRAIDLKNGSVRIMGKGRKERVLPLTKAAVSSLGKYMKDARPKLLKGNADDGGLWIDQYGKRMSASAIHMMFKSYQKKAGVRTHITVHAVRRACVTHMLANGASPIHIQMMLGHATLRHLSQYLSVTMPELKKMHGKSRLGK